jgi:hypothetical protein
MRVCFPGSAMSISLEYFPTPSVTVLVPRCCALAMFIVVDLAWYRFSRGNRPGSVACRAAPLALLPSSIP